MERTAQCQCGSLRAIVTAEPTAVNVCHCKACQRRTGAIIHSGAYFKRSQVQTAGSNRTYTRDASEGCKISFHFCPNCGSSVYWEADIRPDHYGIAVGGFADPDFPLPTYSVWEDSKHAWVRLPEGLEHFRHGRT